MQISVSTNPPKQAELIDYLKSVSNLNVDYIHLDIMDGILVEQKTFDADILPSIRACSKLPIDVHLMVYNPQDEYKNYLKTGVKNISVHYECFPDDVALVETLEDIRRHDIKASIAIKIETPIDDFLPLLRYCDNVLVMSVKIGKSGQKFDTSAYNKIARIKNFIDNFHLKTTIEVDGGVNEENIDNLKLLGVTNVVVGGALYNSSNKAQTISKLKE